jgi:hypothetical protein
MRYKIIDREELIEMAVEEEYSRTENYLDLIRYGGTVRGIETYTDKELIDLFHDEYDIDAMIKRGYIEEVQDDEV